MKDIKCEVQLASEFDSDDDVLQDDVSNKRIVREGLQDLLRDFVQNYVKPELGTAYRTPGIVPFSFAHVPKGKVAVLKIFLPEPNDQLRDKLKLMLSSELRVGFGERAEQYLVLVDYQRTAV